MALTLTPGSESRLDGAPDLALPGYADFVDSVARKLVEMDAEGALYGGDPNNARADAEKWAADYVEGQRGKLAANRAAAEGRAAATAGRRAGASAAARGVSPESLPMDEYGSVSGRTVQEANRPQADAEAALMQDQGIADEIIRGYREGDRNWQAEGDRQYSQEYGLGGFDRGPGRSDLDYRRRLQDQQGFIRTPQGMVPVGPQITPERVESIAEFDDWANQNPGSERQALYAPESYEQHREGVRQDIRDNARQEQFDYATGPDAERNRMLRSQSEDRVAEAQRELQIARLARAAGVTREQARQSMDSARARIRPPLADGGAGPDVPLTVGERRLETQSLRDRAGSIRDSDLAARRVALRDQRMLMAPGARGVVNAINQLGPGWREMALLDRITGGRQQVGPTPLGVQAANMELAAPVIRSALAGAVQGLDPQAQATQRLQQQLALAQLPPEQKIQLSIQMGEPMGTGYSASHVGSRWNYWMNNFGARPEAWREQNFRMEMEGAGYTPAQIDQWIDQRRDFEGAAPPPPAATGGMRPTSTG